MLDEAYLRRCFRHPPELRTQRLLLRMIRRSDAPEMYRYTRDERVTRYVLWEPHRSILDTYDVIRDLRRQYRHGWPSSLAIALAENDLIIGTIGWMWLNVENRAAEIGYSLNPAYWNQGYMTEALRAVIDYSFKTLKLHRLEAQHDIRNPASGRVMEKVGMLREGELKDRVRNKGRYCTVALYAAINPEETKIRERSCLLIRPEEPAQQRSTLKSISPISLQPVSFITAARAIRPASPRW